MDLIEAMKLFDQMLHLLTETVDMVLIEEFKQILFEPCIKKELLLEKFKTVEEI